MSETFYEPFKYLFYLFSAFGLAPYETTKDGFQHNDAILLWNIILLLMLPPSLYYFTSSYYNSNYNGSLIIAILEYLENFGGIIDFTVVLLSSVLNKNKMVRFLNDFISFDMSLGPSIQERIQQFSKKLLIGAVTLSTFFFVLILISVFSKYEINSWTNIFYAGIHFSAASVYSLLVVQYVTLVIMIGARFRFIYKDLQEKFPLKDSHNLFQFESNKELRSSNRTQQEEDLVEALEALWEWYHKLWLMSQELNSIFSIIILLHVLHTTIWIITHLYELFKDIVSIENVTIYGDVTSFLVWLTQLLAIVFASSNTRKNAKLKVLPEIKATSEISLLKTANFSLLLLHENINFSACGFFSIDETLLCSISATVCTYLVIILQFE